MKSFAVWNQNLLSLKQILMIAGMMALYIVSCKSDSGKTKSFQTDQVKNETHRKPHSNFQDTTIIKSNTVVFYGPDSIQLEKIKSLTDPPVFESSMHEYFYQIKTARTLLQRDWRQIKITDVKNSRYLAFENNDHSTTIVDLDTYDDAYGMFLFESGKKPAPVDMSNAQDAIYFYFSN